MYMDGPLQNSSNNSEYANKVKILFIYSAMKYIYLVENKIPGGR